jgi:hypothetical protein
MSDDEVLVTVLAVLTGPACGWSGSGGCPGFKWFEAGVPPSSLLQQRRSCPPLMASHYAWAEPVGDPAGAYAKALALHAGPRGTVAFVHTTSYSDDLQMMSFVGRHLAAAGVSVQFVSPLHLRWHAGEARLDTA